MNALKYPTLGSADLSQPINLIKGLEPIRCYTKDLFAPIKSLFRLKKANFYPLSVFIIS